MTDILTPQDKLDGLYFAWHSLEVYAILINTHRSANAQLAVMAEELGHHHRTVGTVIRQDTVSQRKAEAYGRQWAYDSLLPAQSLATALRSGDCTLAELCARFDLPDSFIREAIAYHTRKQSVRELALCSCHWCIAG